MQIAAERVGVTHDDLAAELREVHTEVDGEQRLADTSATSTDGNDSPRPNARRLEHGRRWNGWREPIGVVVVRGHEGRLPRKVPRKVPTTF